MPATRTDIHRPSAIDPTRYTWFDSYDLEEITRDQHADLYGELLTKLQADSPHGRYDRCAHCGAHLRYIAVMIYVADDATSTIAWGHDCLDTMGMLTSRASAKLRQLQIARQRRESADANQQARDEFAVDHPKLHAFMVDALDNPADHLDFVVDVSRRWNRDPARGLSPRQMSAMRRCMKGREKFLARRAARQAEQASRTPAPRTDKRITVTGVLTKFDVRTSAYGDAWGVMSVTTDDGWTCWGTCPKEIEAALPPEVRNGEDVTDVIRVQFDCRVNVADDNPTHGFIKRPTRARVLDAAAGHRCPTCDATHDTAEPIYHDGNGQVCTACTPLAF